MRDKKANLSHVDRRTATDLFSPNLGLQGGSRQVETWPGHCAETGKHVSGTLVDRSRSLSSGRGLRAGAGSSGLCPANDFTQCVSVYSTI